MVPKIRGTIIGDPYKDSSILGSIWGSPILGNYHVWVDWWKGLRSGKFGLKGAGCFMWGFSTRVAKQNTRKSKMICASYCLESESKSSFKCMGLEVRMACMGVWHLGVWFCSRQSAFWHAYRPAIHGKIRQGYEG